jgi:hypothetical protein
MKHITTEITEEEHGEHRVIDKELTEKVIGSVIYKTSVWTLSRPSSVKPPCPLWLKILLDEGLT